MLPGDGAVRYFSATGIMMKLPLTCKQLPILLSYTKLKWNQHCDADLIATKERIFMTGAIRFGFSHEFKSSFFYQFTIKIALIVFFL